MSDQEQMHEFDYLDFIKYFSKAQDKLKFYKHENPREWITEYG